MPIRSRSVNLLHHLALPRPRAALSLKTAPPVSAHQSVPGQGNARKRQFKNLSSRFTSLCPPPSSYLQIRYGNIPWSKLRSPYGQLKSKCIIRYSKYLGAGCIRISIIYWHHLIYFTPCRSSKSLKTDRRSQVPALALVSFVWLLEFQFSSIVCSVLYLLKIWPQVLSCSISGAVLTLNFAWS
jgi:hypothetical protein